MMDLGLVEDRHYDMVTPVVEELTTTVGIDADQILLVGAACRDILHAAHGHTFEPRATSDTDLGIAVGDWGITEQIEMNYARAHSNGIGYMIADIPVDVMPFGGIEDPEGISHPAPRGQDLVVFGFSDAHARSLPLTLPNGQTIRLPHPAGYVALKMRSWIDRSVAYSHDRDAKDLALACFWYQNSAEIRDRLYDSEDGFAILSELDMEVDVAAVRLLGIDTASHLSPPNRIDLAARWAEQKMDDLARDFLLPVTGPADANLERRRAYVEQLRI